MLRVKTHERNHHTIDYRPECKSTCVPVVDFEFFEGNTRMYQTTDGRQFLADTFDRNFKVRRSAIMPKNFKGDNADYGRRRN